MSAFVPIKKVSTHSRLKAAGSVIVGIRTHQESFNTQPPEGGWAFAQGVILGLYGFNTQPPEGGWRKSRPVSSARRCFNTQPPEGGWNLRTPRQTQMGVSTHSRLKAAGSHPDTSRLAWLVSTHSRLKAAGHGCDETLHCCCVSTHSRLKAAGPKAGKQKRKNSCFNTQPPEGGWIALAIIKTIAVGFNTQPPEGGWVRRPSRPVA